MTRTMQDLIETGEALQDLAADQAEWSQRTFGTDDSRGPVGPLKHLAKEAAETIQAWNRLPFDAQAVRMEFADCLLLLLDASRRAGIAPLSLLRAAQEKMDVNRLREWPAASSSDEPVEHVRG